MWQNERYRQQQRATLANTTAMIITHELGVETEQDHACEKTCALESSIYSYRTNREDKHLSPQRSQENRLPGCE